jgi:hypothetical protein
VRVRDHIAFASGAAALLYPRFGASVTVPWAASILIDVDHYLWFLARHRRLNPVLALRLYNGPHAPHHRSTRVFHHPTVTLLLFLLGRRHRAAVLPLWGIVFHVSLDVYHRARIARVKAAVLSRDDRTCQVCGAHGRAVVAHIWRQPRLHPSYRVGDFVTVCGPCHEAAHTRGAKAIVSASADWESYREDVGRRVLGTAVGCDPAACCGYRER